MSPGLWAQNLHNMCFQPEIAGHLFTTTIVGLPKCGLQTDFTTGPRKQLDSGQGLQAPGKKEQESIYYIMITKVMIIT